MWRDRTNLFISYRQSYSHHPAKKSRSSNYGEPSSLSDERRGLMSAGAFEDDNGDAVIEMDLLPPRWLDIQDEVTEFLADITTQTRKLEALHQKHVLPGFDDEDDKKREEHEIDQLTQAITRNFGACQRAIKRIDKMVSEAKQTGNISEGEEAMAKNLKISLATRVGDVSALFRKKQSAYLKKLRSMGGFASPINRASTPLNPYTDPSLLESESDRALSQSTLQQASQHRQQHHLQSNDTAIAQREREIENIAQGVIELANIFQELQTMVIDQGSMLDRIDYNVERMGADVKEADKELTVATGYQRRSVKRKIMLLLIILIAGMFILLGLKLSSKGSSAPAPAPVPAPVTPPIEEGGVIGVRLVRRASIRRSADALTSNLRRDWRRRRKRASDRASIS